MIVRLHHIALTCGDLERSVAFYCTGLGLKETLRFDEHGQEVSLIDSGGGTYLELFQRARDDGGNRCIGGPSAGEADSSALIHIALEADDIEATVERALKAGATLAEPPGDMTLRGRHRDATARYAFVRGPDGEWIEIIRCTGLGD